MSSPLVTVIIVNWNGLRHLEQCLQSLEAQSFQDFDIVFVDNNSQDESITYVQENFPSVSIIRLEENQGFCTPNNIAMAQAQSKYLCLLNNDTELEHDCLATMVEAIERDPQIGICDAKQVLFDQRDTVFSTGADYTVAGSSIGAGIYVQDENLSDTRDRTIGMAACILYRKTMLDEIGLFDEDFFAGREDVDLSIRALLAGYRIQNVGRAVCYHKISATRGNSSSEYVRRGQRNLHWVFFKNMPASLVRRYILHHLLYTCFTAIHFIRIGSGGAWLLSKWDIIKNYRSLVDKRRTIQRLQKISDEQFAQLLTHNWLRLPKNG